MAIKITAHITATSLDIETLKNRNLLIRKWENKIKTLPTATKKKELNKEETAHAHESALKVHLKEVTQ